VKHHSPIAGNIVQCFLNKIKSNHQPGPMLNIDEILTNVNDEQTKLHLPQISRNDLVLYLEEMKSDPIRYLQSTPISGVYQLHIQNLRDRVQFTAIHSQIYTHFGQLAARVFYLIFEYEKLEETQVCELALAPKKNVRETLYTLMNGNFLELVEVPRTSDRAPMRTFFLWTVPFSKIQYLMLDTFHFSYANLRTREMLESEKIAPLMEKVHTMRALTEDERSTIERWKIAADRLEMGMIKLSEATILFDQPDQYD
jgi:DNA-directed RNA polymerase III subunit RPC3